MDVYLFCVILWINMEAGYQERETPPAGPNLFEALQRKIPAGSGLKSASCVACRSVLAFFRQN